MRTGVRAYPCDTYASKRRPDAAMKATNLRRNHMISTRLRRNTVGRPSARWNESSRHTVTALHGRVEICAAKNAEVNGAAACNRGVTVCAKRYGRDRPYTERARFRARLTAKRRHLFTRHIQTSSPERTSRTESFHCQAGSSCLCSLHRRVHCKKPAPGLEFRSWMTLSVCDRIWCGLLKAKKQHFTRQIHTHSKATLDGRTRTQELLRDVWKWVRQAKQDILLAITRSMRSGTIFQAISSAIATPATILRKSNFCTSLRSRVPWVQLSASDDVESTITEPLMPKAPTIRASQVGTSPTKDAVTPESKQAKLCSTTVEQPRRTRGRFASVWCSVSLLIALLASERPKFRYRETQQQGTYSGAGTCAADRFSLDWPPFALCGGVNKAYHRPIVQTSSLLSVFISAAFGKAAAIEPATPHTPMARIEHFITTAGLVLSAPIPLVIDALLCAAAFLKLRSVVSTFLPVVLSVAASPPKAGGADAVLPAGRAAVNRSRGAPPRTQQPPATLGGAGIVWTEAAGKVAPAVNEAAGAGRWGERRGADAVETEVHKDVVVGVGGGAAGGATAAAVAAAAASMTTQEEGFARESYWATSLRRRWGEQAYLDMVARTINGLENEDFWLAILGKQLQLQSSKLHLKTQRIERHKLEQRRKKQAMSAFTQAQGKADAAALEYQRLQQARDRGGGANAAAGGGGVSTFFRARGPGASGPGPRVFLEAVDGGGSKNEAELRFGELSLYTLDWVGPRTCAQLGWAAGNDVCALSLEIEIHVLHSRLLLKSVEVQDRQNRLFVCDSGAAFFRASAAALAKEEGSDLQFSSAGVGSRSSRLCKGCEGAGGSTLGSTTSTTGGKQDRSREGAIGAAGGLHTTPAGALRKGAKPDPPLAFWDDQGGVEWTYGGGSKVGTTGAAGTAGTKDKEKGTTGIGADKRRGSRGGGGGGGALGAAATQTASPSVGRPQVILREKGGKKGQKPPPTLHYGGGGAAAEKHQHHQMFAPEGGKVNAVEAERTARKTTKKRRRTRRKKKISSSNTNVAASLGTLNEVFHWDTIAHDFYIPALADLQPIGKNAVEDFTTELTYLMGVLDREESLRSGKPIVTAANFPQERFHPHFVYKPMQLTEQLLGADRAGAERVPGVGFFPFGRGGQMQQTLPYERQRTARRGMAWPLENWPGARAFAAAQESLGPAAVAAAPPAATAFHGPLRGHLQDPAARSINPAARIDMALGRRSGALTREKAEEKVTEAVENDKEKSGYPLRLANSPPIPQPYASSEKRGKQATENGKKHPVYRPFPQGSYASPEHGAALGAPDDGMQQQQQQEQQPQFFPWRSTAVQSPNTLPSQPRAEIGLPKGQVFPVGVQSIHPMQAQPQQQNHFEEGDDRFPFSPAYERLQIPGSEAQGALVEANNRSSTSVRNKEWWNQRAAGARGENGMRQGSERANAETEFYADAIPEPQPE